MHFNALPSSGNYAVPLHPAGGAARALSDTALDLIDGATQLGTLNPERLADDLARRSDVDRQRLLDEIAPRLPERDRASLVQSLHTRGKPTDIAGDPSTSATADAKSKPKSDDEDASTLLWDVAQIALDIVGIFDPTPISDGINGVISLARQDYAGAATSAAGMLPFIGDAAKLGKLGRHAETIAKVIEAAKTNPALAEKLAPALQQVRTAIEKLPLDKLPRQAREALEPIRSKLDEFAQLQQRGVKRLPGETPASAAQRLDREITQAHANGARPEDLSKWEKNRADNLADARKEAAQMEGAVPGRLLPNHSYELNGYKYTTDAKGRIKTVEGELRLDPAARNGSAQSTVGVNDGRLPTDQGGHLIGAQFGGYRGVENLTPMNKSINNYHAGEWGVMEKRWAKELEAGKSVDVKIEVKYSDDSMRATEFKVTENINGVIKTRRIQNPIG